MNKKNIVYLAVFAVLAVVCTYLIGRFSGCPPQELLNELTDVNLWWILGAVALTFGFIYFEGKALVVLIKGLSPIKHARGNLYASADIYFSAITPSATGGQPASAYLMVKDGVPVAVTTVILLVNLVVYMGSLFVCGLISLIFATNLFLGYEIISKAFIIIGILIIIICICFFSLVLKREAWVRNFFEFMIRIGVKFKLIRHPERRLNKLNIMMKQYRTCSDGIAGKRKIIFKAFVYNMLQRLSRGGVFICCYMALGGRCRSWFTVWAAQTYAALGANILPIPGGIGTTDYLLMDGFGNIADIDNAAGMTLLGRGISFYGCLIISIIILVTAYLKDFRKNVR